jgi:hypothetical protein
LLSVWAWRRFYYPPAGSCGGIANLGIEAVFIAAAVTTKDAMNAAGATKLAYHSRPGFMCSQIQRLAAVKNIEYCEAILWRSRRIAGVTAAARSVIESALAVYNYDVVLGSSSAGGGGAAMNAKSQRRGAKRLWSMIVRWLVVIAGTIPSKAARCSGSYGTTPIHDQIGETALVPRFPKRAEKRRAGDLWRGLAHPGAALSRHLPSSVRPAPMTQW